MKRKVILVLSVIAILFSFTSCKVSKQYVQYISKKEEISAPSSKRILTFATDKVTVREFKKTFEKNYIDDSYFISELLNEFAQKAAINSLFAEVSVDTENATYASINKENSEYAICFSNIEISNRVEISQTGGMGMNGMGGMPMTTSVEYCIISVKVEVYDTKTATEILDFVAIGEESVFLFDFTKTLLTAKERVLTHIINYLKTGKTEYVKY
jgi:hypothetical protein